MFVAGIQLTLLYHSCRQKAGLLCSLPDFRITLLRYTIEMQSDCAACTPGAVCGQLAMAEMQSYISFCVYQALPQLLSVTEQSDTTFCD